jgi:peptide/nickel transport system permease protein
MAQTAAVDLTEPLVYGRARRRSLRRLRLLARQQPLGVVGLVLITFIVLVAIGAPQIGRYSPLESRFELLQGPTWSHPFGTDRLGRDVYARVVHGARTSMSVGIASVGLAAVAGTAVGMLSGYMRGWVDSIIQRLVDVIMAFPFLVLALYIGSVIGRDVNSLILVLGIAMTPGIVRVVRGSVLVEREKDYVLAARALGAGDLRIMFRHLLPNVAAPVIIIATTLLSAAILAEAALSFLGFGIPPPKPSWGGDLSGNARAFFQVAPWMAIFPGLALSLAVLGFNFLGDALRDVLDPRLRGTGPQV